MTKPTPEEKCSHDWDDGHIIGEIRQCVHCGKFEKPSPSPEARVGCMCGSGYASDCKVHNPSEAREYPMKRWCRKRKKWVAGMWREL
jgi:hypothetical protein